MTDINKNGLSNLKVRIKRKTYFGQSIKDAYDYLLTIVDNQTLNELKRYTEESNNCNINKFDIFHNGAFLNYFCVNRNIESVNNYVIDNETRHTNENDYQLNYKSDEYSNQYIQILSGNLLIQVFSLANTNATYLELENTQNKLREQKHNIKHLQECLERKNKELDSLHYVWCTGGCGKGYNRYNDLEIPKWITDTKNKLTSELIETAEHNIQRLKSYYHNFNDRHRDK